MKRVSSIIGAVALFVLLLAGCSLFGGTDVIVGRWQQVSVNSIPTLLVTVVQFTDNTYNGTTAGVATNTGTWTKSGSAYTLTGVFFGFLASSSTISPAFTSSNNTMTYTDANGFLEVYNRL
jgi:hypothetical protein